MRRKSWNTSVMGLQQGLLLNLLNHAASATDAKSVVISLMTDGTKYAV